MLYYIYRRRPLGRSWCATRSIARCERGVTVALLIDGFGSSNTPDDFFDDLRKAGATFCRFHPSWGRRYLLRNHQKMLLADGESDTAAC